MKKPLADKLRRLRRRVRQAAAGVWRRVAAALQAVPPHNWLFSVALAAIAVGLWWERPSLALIVPGVIVCGGMFAAWWRMSSAHED